MEYDLEVLVPVSSKFSLRLEHFKKFGLVNICKRKILLNIILSNEEIYEVDKGWANNIDVNVIKGKSKCHVSNIYKFYADIDPEKICSRWFIRLDDDSCTDVEGLVSNLDLFYDCDIPFCLGDLTYFSDALNGNEGWVYDEYKHLLGEYERIALKLKSEIECGILSRSALFKIVSTERSRKLIEHRARLEGGYGDCVVPIAAALIKIYGLSCPFVTHRPRVHEFSMLGGIYNHIHMISPDEDGENFAGRVSNYGFKLLIKSITNSATSVESKIIGSRFLLETENDLKTFDFNSNYSLKIKFDSKMRGWYEEDGKILIVHNDQIEHKLELDNNGDLSGDIFLKRI